MKRFYNIELLRFFSALSVLIYHYQHFFGPYSSFSITDINNNKFTQPFYSSLEILYNYGYFGVPMFWSISGFVFAYVYLEQQKDISGKNFFVNRFARLYPLHFATLLIVTLLQIISYKLTGNFQIYTFNELYHFLLHLFFISGWGFQIGNSFNEPIWSVSVELIIYILFFISIIYLNKYKIKLVVLIYLIFLSIDKSGFESIFIDCARLFYTGVFVYFLYEKFEKKFYLIFLSILLIFLSTIVGNFKIYLFFPSVLLLFVALETFVHEKIKKNFQFFGNLTYAMYLLHVPVSIFIILIFGYLNIVDEIFLNNYFFFLYFLFMMLLSFICYRFFEKPLNKKIRSFFSSSIKIKKIT